MFGIFRKDPLEKAKKQHADLLKQAMDAQRAGNILEFARLTSLAEKEEAKVAELTT